MKVLAIGAHPDDIEPQIGGTIAKIVKENGKVLNVVVTDTGTGANIEDRNYEGKQAAKILGASFLSLGIPQLEKPHFRELVNSFDNLISIEKPDLIFSVNSADSHQDHKDVAQAIEASCRKNTISVIECNQALPGGIHCPDLNYFVDISKEHEIKIKSLKAYSSQIEKYGTFWIEAIESRDKLWGFNIGSKFAEACKIKKLIK